MAGRPAKCCGAFLFWTPASSPPCVRSKCHGMKRASKMPGGCAATVCAPGGTMNGRLKFDAVSCEPRTLVTRAQVQLSIGSTQRIGVATGLTATVSPLHIVAEATIDAVQGFIDHADITLDSVAEVTTGQRPLVVVTMGLRDARGKIMLAGTAVLNGDPYLAVAKAVLHALNRRVGSLLHFAFH